MRVRTTVAVSILTVVALGSPALGATDAPAPPTVLAVEGHLDRATDVRTWSPASPQRLVRIDGELYQRNADLYLPAIADRITVRLAAGIKSWDELVARATGGSPASFGVLADLEPLRTNRLGIVDLALPPGTDPVAWCEVVQQTGLVRYAEIPTSGVYHATQSDPRYPEQWALHNTGQTGGTAGADIDAERAWDLTAGDPSIIVAILDSGTDVDHEDLAANVWHNDAEIPGNGVDDDANGYIDDWEGWDFDTNTNDPRSTNYHGTHVTGIVNAAGSNGLGVAGLAGGLGGPGVRGMALGVGAGAPNSGVIDDAILYAADHGARVITLSLGVGETQAINDALDYAYNTMDVFIDCASGNSGSSVNYPATRPEVMAVGASDHNDLGSGFSNPGPEVEVAAPGSSVLSTQLADSYATSDGTSFAAPYVAGLAALIRSRNPGLAAPDVRQMIIDSAEDIEAAGFDDKTGFGRINAFDAVSLAATSDGTIRLDAAGYACADVVALTASDIDLAGMATLTVHVSSDTEPGGEPTLLTETGSSSGVFRGSIDTTVGSAVTDGALQVADGDTIVAEYVDADDGAGGSDVVKTATAPVDCVAPAISAVAASNVSNTSATIVWDTDEPADSLVHHGEFVPPSNTSAVAAQTAQHAVTLNGLAECTIYKYAVTSSDPEGNTATDDNGGVYHVFETQGDIPGLGIVPCHQGYVELDRDGTYACGDTVAIAVVDIDLNVDPAAVETVQVLATSTSEPDGEWVALTETGNQSSRFEGSIPLGGGIAVAADGLLAVSAGNLITATYYDADAGQGQSRIDTDSSTTDCLAPAITDVKIVDISATRAVVEWTTAEAATSKVEFGSSSALGSVAEGTTLTTAHSVPISGFDACDRAYFRVTSADLHGDAAIADADGAPFELNLNQIGGLVYHETFETDTGWTLPGDWERGTPQGLGTAPGDPGAAWSGSFAIGQDLSGLGANPGDYEPVTSMSAISPVIDARQQRNLELIIRRKLGVTSGDEAGIYVITNGTDQAWTSNYQVDDADWWEQRKDISAWADNKSSVQLEFRLESTTPDHSYGWNIDELIVKDSTEPDYLTCGGCAGVPGFRGVRAVYDPDPCGAGGLSVEWEAATAWGTGSSGTYDVHRGTTPGFTPDTSNRIVSGLTGTSWTDATAPVDTPVWYVVRARNDESCAGGEGLADLNNAYLGSTETTSLSLPAPVGDTLVAGSVGSAHVRLEWAPAAGADRYVIHRGQSFDFSDAVEIGSTSGTLFEDPDAASAASAYNYRVLAVDACGRSE